jgi:hypothetical protein
LKTDKQLKKDLEMLDNAAKLDKREVLSAVLKDHNRTQVRVAEIKRGSILLDDAGH